MNFYKRTNPQQKIKIISVSHGLIISQIEIISQHQKYIKQRIMGKHILNSRLMLSLPKEQTK